MGLISLLEEWASAGAKIEPLTSWIQNGWQYRHRPERQYWNWFEGHRDATINKVIESEASLRTISPYSDYGSMCSQMNPDWADPMTSLNYLSTGSAIKDSCIGWDHANGKPVLYVLQGNSIYPVTAPWTYDAAPALGSALSLSYSSTPTDVMNICSDGDYLYVVYGVTGSYVYLAKFDLISFTGTDIWSVGTGLTYSVIPDSTLCDMICISDTQIGLLISTISQPSYMEIFIITKTTGAWSKGYGNGTSSDYMDAREARLVSDGSRVYWMVHTGASTCQSILNSALISAPSGSPFSRINIGSTYSYGAPDTKTGLALCRDCLVVGNQLGEVYTYTPGESAADNLLDISNNAIAAAYDTPVVMKSDGLNLWAFLIKNIPGGTPSYSYGFYPIPSGLVTRALAGSSQTDVVKHGIFVPENTYTDGNKAGNLLCDGRDMWLVTESGDLFRICNPGAR